MGFQKSILSIILFCLLFIYSSFASSTDPVVENNYLEKGILPILSEPAGRDTLVPNDVVWGFEGTKGDNISLQYIPKSEDGTVSFEVSSSCDGLFGLYAQSDFTENANNLSHGIIFSRGEMIMVEEGKIKAKLGRISSGNHTFAIKRIGANIFYYMDDSSKEIFKTAADPNENLHLYSYFKEGQCSMSNMRMTSAERLYALLCGNYYVPKRWEIIEYYEFLWAINYIANAFPSDASDPTENWVHTDVYDGIGEGPCHIISKKRVYADDMGRHTQTQVKDFVTDKVWVSETHYDSYGREAISTLSAPSGINYIEKKDGFFLDEDENEYGVDDYDGVMTNSPAVVGEKENTLGHWYSTNNTEDPYQAITDYPYARTEYSELTGAPRRTAGAGDAYHMGEGHESVSYIMPVDGTRHEMNYLIGYKQSICLLVDTEYDEDDYLKDLCNEMPPINFNMKFGKSISVDADGKVGVAFMDMNGNEVARALSGQVDGNNVHTQGIITVLEAKSYRDIHIPKGCGNTFSQTTLSDSEIEIWDLSNDMEIQLNADESLDAGFYRLVNKTYTDAQITYQTNYHNFTLNIYDLVGQLVATIAPNDIDYNLDPLSGSGNTPNHIKEGFSYYRFNSTGQLQWEKTIDRGETEYFYRKDGSVRFSVNANQKAEGGRFSYTNYDEFHRVVESGVFVTGQGMDMTTYLESNTDNTNFESDFSNANKEEESFIVYDKPITSDGLPAIRPQRHTEGRISKAYNENEEIWYSYDEFGRTEMVAKKVSNLGRRYIHYKFDNLGNTTEVKFEGGQKKDKFTHLYSHNREGQLQSVSTREGDGVAKLQASYGYNQGGSIKEFNLADGLQNLEYAYTLQGQLKAINPNEMTTTNNGDDISVQGDNLFSMVLHYHENDYKAADIGLNLGLTNKIDFGGIQGYNNDDSYNYTGRIAVNEWKTNAQVGATPDGDMSGRYAYIYQYNHRNELKSAHFGIYGQVSPPIGGNSNFYTPSPYYNVTNLTYDLNGNIQTLDRSVFNSSSYQTQMDKLTYQYQPDNGNRLLGIKDLVVGADSGLGDITNRDVSLGANYLYDEMGQLTEDNAEDMKITYNTAGLVTKVKDLNDVLRVEYFYGPTGQKVKRIGYVYNGSNLIRKDITLYLKDDDGTLHSIYERETYPNNSSSNTPFTQIEIPIYATGRIGVAYKENSIYTYRYELTDHLGNVRAVIGEVSGSVEVYSYADYYPFGWKMPGRQTTSGEKYRFGYQGQFAEEDEEAGWVSFELRTYDARIARWTSIDPAEQFHSPYVAMGNNPVNMIDRDGAFAEEPPELKYENIYFISSTSNPIAGTSTGLLRLQYAIRTRALKSLYNLGDAAKLQKGFDGRHLIKKQTRDWMHLTPSSRYALRNAHDVSKYKIFKKLATNRFLNHHYQVGSADAVSPRSGNIRKFYTFDKPLTGFGLFRGVSGTAGLLMAGYRMKNAENKAEEAAKIGAGFGGALLGAELFGGACALVCPHPYVVGGFTLFGGIIGGFGGEAAVEAAMDLPPVEGPTTCFVAGTKILMFDGTEKNIENIVEGDLILNVNTTSMTIEIDTVVLIPKKKKEYKRIAVFISNEVVLELSPAHPIYVKGKGWSVFDLEEASKELSFSVSQMEVGDIIFYYERGHLMEYTIEELNDSGEYEIMYNVEFVKKNHCFFANKILVHNKRIKNDFVKNKFLWKK